MALALARVPFSRRPLRIWLCGSRGQFATAAVLARKCQARRYGASQLGRTVRAIIFDPINAYFGTKDSNADSFKTSDMRAVLTPLAEWSAKHRIAVIGITHFNKDKKGQNLLHRIVDSQAISAATRTVWACLDREDEDGNTQLIFARGKNNVGPSDTPALVYEIEAMTVQLDDFEGEVSAPGSNGLARQA